MATGNGLRAVRAILLVEDNLADIQITQRALRATGLPAELIVVRDGQEAMDYLLRSGDHAGNPTWRSPALILLDPTLPRLNGHQVLQHIRASAELRTVPVVVFSTSDRPEDVQGVYAAGANTYIQKPQDFGRFVDVLQTIQRYWL